MRVSPSATLSERVAAHSVRRDGHLVWEGFLHNGIPALTVMGHRPERRVLNVRRVQLELAGWPSPPGRQWIARVTCGSPLCVDPAHLMWVGRRQDAVLSDDVVDELIRAHAAGRLNVADAADGLGVTRQTVYRSMRRRGYRPSAI